ncbi:MAG: pyridoxal phosphate-dependent aminotransferase [Candidatus Micrarchaeota archaeon]
MLFYEFMEQVFAREAKGERIARLFVGEPEEPPAQAIRKAAAKALMEGNCRYSSAAGLPELREKIAARHSAASENVAITPGGKFAVFAAIKAVTEGGSVCVPTPHWPGYDSACAQLGISIKRVETSMEDKWLPSPERLSEAMDRTTKLVILCTPNNPTSTQLPAKLAGELAGVAKDNGAMVLFDEAYRGLSFNETRPRRLRDGEMIAGSFSKEFSMTGFRCGYLAAETSVVEKAVSLAQASFSCVPEFVQAAAIKALSMPRIARRNAHKCRRNTRLASDILGRSMDFAQPDAGFYIFATRKGLDGDSLCMRLLKKGVGVAPGSAFGSREFIRISLTQKEDALEKSLEKIAGEAR